MIETTSLKQTRKKAFWNSRDVLLICFGIMIGCTSHVLMFPTSLLAAQTTKRTTTTTTTAAAQTAKETGMTSSSSLLSLSNAQTEIDPAPTTTTAGKNSSSLFTALSNEQTTTTGTNSSSSLSLSDVQWVMGSPHDFAKEFERGSKGLSDKTNGMHKFQLMYQPHLSRYIRNKVAKSSSSSSSKKSGGIVKFRLLEIGLGCAPGGGMIQGKPGGSAFAWRYLFDQIPGVELDLHVFEYDEKCANRWAEENIPSIATKVHVGDASSEHDLERAYRDSGGIPFDVIIDDASHINWHQIKTLDYMLPKLTKGGFYAVEDINSSCKGWRANMGTHRGEDVGGASSCMITSDGKPTILAHLMEYQRCLVGTRNYERTDRGEFLKDLESIEIQTNIAVLKKHE